MTRRARPNQRGHVPENLWESDQRDLVGSAETQGRDTRPCRGNASQAGVSVCSAMVLRGAARCARHQLEVPDRGTGYWGRELSDEMAAALETRSSSASSSRKIFTLSSAR